MTNKIETQPKKTDVIHYIVVVHGIGQQRKNETVLPVIEQFAAARHKDPEQKSYLTLGRLTSQSKENVWIEYQNIPDSPDPSLKKPWVPIMANNSQGENIRFVDFCWSDVTRKAHSKVGEPTKKWTDSLINRLKLRVSVESKTEEVKGTPTQWIVDMMETMQEGALFIEKIMGFRLPHLSNEIFGAFLGDVEVYGDFPGARGRAVRLFHETMAKVHATHLAEFPDNNVIPHYTIIAHSLGTVLTMDAIAYAYANDKSRQSTAESTDDDSIVHFPGYNQPFFPEVQSQAGKNKTDSKNTPEVDWIEYLHSYITLGSPIDKYLALWPENYSHFNNKEWMDKARINAKNKDKIQHFNYSDEQDPVGHELNILKSTAVWDELADIPEDIVFNRYIWPGLAHIEYWKDNQLFSRILELNIDNCKQYKTGIEPQNTQNTSKEKEKIKWFDSWKYTQSLFISFVAIPFLGWLIATYLLNTTLTSYLQFGFKDFPLLSFLFASITAFITHILMKLLIEWHIVLGESRKRAYAPKEKKERDAAQSILDTVILLSTSVFTLLSVTILFGADSVLPENLSTPLTVGIYLACLLSIDVLAINYRMHSKWKNNMVETDFSEYLKPFNKS